jgi:hypothetical protein
MPTMSGISNGSGSDASSVGSSSVGSSSAGSCVGSSCGSSWLASAVSTASVTADTEGDPTGSPPPELPCDPIAMPTTSTAAAAAARTQGRRAPLVPGVGVAAGAFASLIQNCQPAGAGGHDGSGRQSSGGVHPGGGDGQPGGGLNRAAMFPPGTRACAKRTARRWTDARWDQSLRESCEPSCSQEEASTAHARRTRALHPAGRIRTRLRVRPCWILRWTPSEAVLQPIR